MTRTRPPEPSTNRSSHGATIWIGYAVIGVILGALWLWGGGEPVWEHALRTALFVVIVLPASYYGAQTLRARRGRSPLPRISIVRIIGAKLLLLLVALVVEYLLQDATSHADQIVAAGLFVVVAVGGPLAHRLFVPSSPAPRSR